MRHSHQTRFLLTMAALAAVAVLGCGGSRRDDGDVATQGGSRLAAALQSIGSAPAALAVSEPMRPFFAAGLAFIVLGGLVVFFGGRGSGFLLMGLGVATTATGVLFVQYPWAVLLLALAAGVLAAAAIFDRMRARKELAATVGELDRSTEALEATAQVIQNIPEGKAVKTALSNLGSDAEAKVRRVISPIKDKLRREGRIKD